MTATALLIHSLAPKFHSEHWTEPVPPVTHRLKADLDTTLIQHAFNVTQRQRKPNAKHYRQADDLWAGLEIAERGTLGHVVRLAGCPDRLKESSFDNTPRAVQGDYF